MGLLSRLFKTDPRKAQARAEEILKKAEMAESSGFFDDAVEWIEAALEHIDDQARRGELESRMDRLRGEADQQRKVEGRIDFSDLASGDIAPEDLAPGDLARASGVDEGDSFENLYEALVNTLDDDVAAGYDNRPEEFRRAVVTLYEGPGQAARVLPTLEELVAADPDDPIYRLERGRCRLLCSDFDGAKEDMESIWETFGDEPLDHAASLSVPGLWAEAMLGARRPEELLERLDDVAVPAEADSTLCYYYSVALMQVERLEDARVYLMAVMERFSQPDFPHQLGAVLYGLGRFQEAIDTLERAIAPSCASGSCGKVAKHVPSLRSLAGLYVNQGQRFDRVEQLIRYIAQAQGGELQGEDYQLLALYHRARGDEEAALEALEQARSMAEVQADPAVPDG